MSTTSIEWCDRNWSYMQGCSHKDTGCRNCYAESIAHIRVNNQKLPQYTPEIANWDGHLNLHIPGLIEPLLREKGASWFPSMTDPFHQNCPDEWIALMFCVMALSPQHQFLILTKRPERIQKWLDSRIGYHIMYVVIDDYLYWAIDRYAAALGAVAERSEKLSYTNPKGNAYEAVVVAARRRDKGDSSIWDKRCHDWPLPNVAFGTSIAAQPLADERMPIIHNLYKQGWKTFVSAEPLIEAVDLQLKRFPCNQVIVGGESGHGARPFHLDWARSLVNQCQANNVNCFVKQLGKQPWDKGQRLFLSDSKGGDMGEWPVELRVRQPLF